MCQSPLPLRTLLSLGLAILTAGCGDISKSSFDAGIGSADAALVQDSGTDAGSPVTRRGSIQVAELTVLAPGALGTPKGIDVRVEFAQLDSPSSTPIIGNDQPGGCTVWHHPAALQRKEQFVDEGDVAYSGNALLDTPFPTCRWIDDAYACVVAESEGNVASLSAPFIGSAFTVPAVNFRVAPYVGARGLNFDVSGFANASNNQRYHTIGVQDPQSPNVLPFYWIAGGSSPVAEANATGIAWRATLAGPFTGIFGANHTFDFLSPNSSNPGTLTLSKTAGATLAPFSATMTPAGQGMVLESTNDQPHAMPFTARDITFRCAGNSCSPPTGEELELFSITGYTTTESNYPVSDASIMPPSLPGTTWAEFECHFIGGTSATIPAAVWAKVLETNPKRIETTVSYSSAKIFIDDGNRTMIRVGHGVRGYSTFAP